MWPSIIPDLTLTGGNPNRAQWRQCLSATFQDSHSVSLWGLHEELPSKLIYLSEPFLSFPLTGHPLTVPPPSLPASHTNINLTNLPLIGHSWVVETSCRHFSDCPKLLSPLIYCDSCLCPTAETHQTRTLQFSHPSSWFPLWLSGLLPMVWSRQL